MPDSKISELSLASSLNTTDVVPIVQGSTNRKTTLADLATFVGDEIGTGGGGTGDVSGPVSSTDNAVARWDGTGGSQVQNSPVLIGDTGAVSGVSTLAMTGALTAGGNVIANNISAGSTVAGANTGDQTGIVGITDTKAHFNAACSDGDFLYVGDVAAPTTIVGITGTKAQFSTAVTDGDILYVGDVVGFTVEAAQDAVGAMVNTSLTYDDTGNALKVTSRNINGVAFDHTADITVPATSRLTALTDPVGASPATVTPNADTTDVGYLTALSQDTLFVNPSGTPANGQRLTIRIKSTTARALTWGNKYRGSTDLPLPSLTSGSTLTDYIGFIYNSADTKWDYLAKNFGF